AIFANVGDQLDSGRLYRNALAWASGIADQSVRIVTPSAGTRTWLIAQGYTQVTLRSDWQNALGSADVLVTELGRSVSPAQQQAVASFVTAGGGLITGGTGWGYASLGSDLTTLPGNQVLRQAGLAWTDGFRGSGTQLYSSTELGNATAALAMVNDLWAGGSASASQQAEAGKSLQAVLSVLPDDDPLMLQIEQAFSARAASVAATPATPVSNALDKSVLTWEAQRLLDVPLDQIVAHTTADAVYGVVPPAASREAATVVIDGDPSGWLATGYYAAPGEIVTIEFPQAMVGRGFRVQLSGHVDNISSRDSWSRLPFGVARSFDINAATVRVGSAFGGAIYVDVGKTPAGLGEVVLNVAGAVAAPRFVLGRTTNEEWLASQRDNPAPYAELVSEGVAMSVPSAWIRDLDDPTALMTYWNEATAREDYVGALETFRSGPERFNVDVQISAGLLHAGYPIQGPTWASEELVDLESLLREGNWGYFHELGHEMQRRPDERYGNDNAYTFPGDVEVTVNIFANAALEAMVAEPPLSGWGWSAYPKEVMLRASQTVHDAAAVGFDAKDPYPFYFQLADGFGWDAYRQVFAGYHDDFANAPQL
ncbi:MAG: M60 family metallopeptidase, partial [Planctomycetales bacterium]|nr:M60 family metallopeptidase [Planctomycetales bacterium]